MLTGSCVVGWERCSITVFHRLYFCTCNSVKTDAIYTGVLWDYNLD